MLPPDAQDAQKLREGEFGEALLKSFESKGVVGVALWPNSVKNFTSNKPLENRASFGGQKFRVMDSKILIEQFDALGASVQPPYSEPLVDDDFGLFRRCEPFCV